jgi:FkbM family methyltransferase
MRSNFYIHLLKKIITSLNNDFSDNYDELRFGPPDQNETFKRKIYKWLVKSRFIPKVELEGLLKETDIQLSNLDPYLEDLDAIYSLLSNQQSKDLLIDLMAYRVLGHKKVKLPVNNSFYWKGLDTCKKLENLSHPLETGFLNWKLGLYDLTSLGYNLKLNFTRLGVFIDFILEQYKYQSPQISIEVKPGDVVIEGGGCWGDTALYFAEKSGKEGMIYTFEFIPKNLKLLKHNLSLNPHISNIHLIEHPMWEKKGIDTYFIDNGPASRVSFEKITNNDGKVTTQSIDSLVKEKSINKVDFIKMDIEGAELFALKGAEETIKKFRPNLAIAIYHTMDDFVNIPQYIHSLNLGYNLYLGHYTIFQEETLIFATTSKK